MREQEEKQNIHQDYDDWKKLHEAAEQLPEELFKQISHIAITLSYDLIDKLRYFEKETLKLSEDEISERLGHMRTFLDTLKRAYLDFAETAESDL